MHIYLQHFLDVVLKQNELFIGTVANSAFCYALQAIRHN